MSLIAQPAVNVVKVDVTKTRSSEYEFEMEIGSNTIPAEIGYVDSFTGWLTRVPALGSAHPDFEALKLKKFKGSGLDGDLIRVRLIYECNNPEVNYPGRASGKIKRYGLEPSTGEEPLLTHHLFKDLTDAEKEALQALMASPKAAADFTAAAGVVTSEEGIKAISKIRRGTEAYLNPGLVWVERFTTDDLDDIELEKILETTDSPPGPCPNSGTLRNWLYLAGPASPHEDGEFWDIERRWQLSEKGKWDEDFYEASA